MIFTDHVIEEINRHIGLFPPERGGAILGSDGSNLITEFIYDPDGLTSTCSYFPSKSLIQKVQDIERNNSSLVFKGIIHSHPGGLDRPSGQDLNAFAKGLQINPHMPCFIAPIVSSMATEKLQPHEMKIESGKKISLYSAWRNEVRSTKKLDNVTLCQENNFRYPRASEIRNPVKLIKEDIGQMDCLYAARIVQNMLCELLREKSAERLSIERGASVSLNDTHFESVIFDQKNLISKSR